MAGFHEFPSRRFSMDEIRKVTDDFNESKILEVGGFSRVYKGILDDDSTQSLVAVKQTLDPESKQGILALQTELQLLSQCKHRNLVNLLGYCSENQDTILVYEYISKGNLADHLYGNQGSLLTWEQRLKICLGTARGLDYLQTGTQLPKQIVHLDIKSENIFLDDSWAAKVGNQPNSHVNTAAIRGTMGYMAPEYFKTGTYSRKSDVYSFEVLLLEVLSGTSVWGGQIIPKSNLADWIQQHISNQTLDQIIDPRIENEIQLGSLKRFVYTASKSLQLDFVKRPSMSSVVAQLESALELQSSSPIVDEDGPFEVGYEGQTSRWNSVPVELSSDKVHTVFGKPIGDKEMVEMGLDPTRFNRAKVANKMWSHDALNTPLSFLIDLKKRWGHAITTLCMIYNETGETLTYVTSRNLYGETAPVPYPMEIQNGQWGVFMHRKTLMVPNGSVGAVVYRGRYSNNGFCDRMFAWSNTKADIKDDNDGKSAYCEINEVGHFDETDWDVIFRKVNLAGIKNGVTWNDCLSRVVIGCDADASTKFVAITATVHAI